MQSTNYYLSWKRQTFRNDAATIAVTESPKSHRLFLKTLVLHITGNNGQITHAQIEHHITYYFKKDHTLNTQFQT